MIPICDVGLQHAELSQQIADTVAEVIASGKYILGPHVRAFEQEMADYLGVQYAVGLNSGTDALHLALRAMGIGPGDEVITTPFTFVATTESILMVGAIPVFVDINPFTFNIDVEQVAEKITAKTKAIIPVHLFGQPCEMDTLTALANEKDLRVVEDCAQALGASYRSKRAGSFGDVGCLSFFPSKNLGGIGDGGMLVTNDKKIYEQAEVLRRHGGRVKYFHETAGLNSRLDEIQAAVLRLKLSRLTDWNEHRQKLAYAYNVEFQSTPQITCPHELRDGEYYPPCLGSENSYLQAVYHQYTILSDNRAELQKTLAREDIASAIYYPLPLHLQELHRDLGYQKGDFPNAEHVADNCLSLPIFPGMTSDQRRRVTAAVRNFVEQDEYTSVDHSN